MRYTIARDRSVPAPRRFTWGITGLGLVLIGSAALAWQNGNGKLRTAVVEEVSPAVPTYVPPAKEDIPQDEPLPQRAPIVERAPSASPSTNRPTAPATSATTRSAARARTQAQSNSDERESWFSFSWPFFGRSKERQAPAPAQNSTNSRPRAGSAKALGYNRNPRVSPQSRTAPATAEPTPEAMRPEIAAPEVTLPPIVSSPQVAGPESSQDMPQGIRPSRSVANPRVRRDVATVTPGPAETTPARSDAAKTTSPRAVMIENEHARVPGSSPSTVTVGEAPEIVQPTTPRIPAKRPPVRVLRDRPQVAALPKTLPPLSIPKVEDVRPAGFQKVTPGQTRLSSVVQQLGEPAATERDGEMTVMTYEVGPFPKVEVLLNGDVVDSIVIHLKEPVRDQDVLTELGLTEFRPVDIVDETGTVLGMSIPERGVALSYDGDAQERKVAQVVLASVTAEPFVLRAASVNDHNYTKVLADARFAASLGGNSPDAHALQAQVLLAVGRPQEALNTIKEAGALDEQAAVVRLLHARILAKTGEHAEAQAIAEAVVGDSQAEPEAVAEAQLVWGDMLSHGETRDYPAAIEHYTQAIKLATPLLESDDPLVKRSARHTLIDANLGVARSIALGNYKRKTEVVPKWIAKAESIAAAAIEEGKHDYLKLYVPARALEALAATGEPIDPSETVDTVLQQGQDLIASADDPLYKHQLEWELGTALLHAVQIEHARGEFEAGLQHGNNALALLSQNAAQREPGHEREYTLGRLYFSLGALYAIGHEDHAEAVHYYLQAIPLLEQPLPPEAKEDEGRHGERFVSMGVSFWQNGNKAQAVELTLAGAELLRKAIESGQIDKGSLAVPYGNLAAMYKQLGNTTEAKKYTDLASRLTEQAAGTTRR